MRNILLVVVLLAEVLLGSCVLNEDSEDQGKTYGYSWESIISHPVPDWFNDAKLGIFIHWGPQSIWDGPWRAYQDTGRYYAGIREKFGETPPEFGYKDVIPMFRAENWDPEEWADLFEKAGARYVILTGEHHDGFMLSESGLTEWCTTSKGPMRDLVGDLGKAVRAKGIKYAPSYHRERHAGMFSKEKYIAKSPPCDDIAEEIERMSEAEDLYGPFEYNEDFYDSFVSRWKEWEKKYHPDFMWIDDIPFFYHDAESPQVDIYRERCMKMIADYLNMAEECGKEVYFNNKGRAEPNWPAGAGCFEYDMANYDTIVQTKWQCPMTMGHTWFYNELEDRENLYKSPAELVHLLCDITSKNGNLLLNVGPRPDGTIAGGMVKRLLALGDWLELNGEAIYGTRPWIRFKQDDPEIRFTQRDNDLYAILFDKPGRTVLVKSAGKWAEGKIADIRLLGNDNPVKWKRKGDDLEIYLLPVNNGEHAWVLKISRK